MGVFAQVKAAFRTPVRVEFGAIKNEPQPRNLAVRNWGSTDQSPKECDRLMQPILDVPTSVYRYYDKTGVLLYVGITSRATARQREHNADKEWWAFVARQEVEHFPSRGAASDREKGLIRQFRPPFNTHHNPDHEVIRAVYLASGLGGNKAQRGGGRRPSLTSRGVRQAWAECKGRIDLELADHDRFHFVYSTPPEYSQLITESQFPAAPPVMLLAPTKVATFEHRFIHEDHMRLAFRRGSRVAPVRAVLLIKARQPFSLYAHKAMAAS